MPTTTIKHFFVGLGALVVGCLGAFLVIGALCWLFLGTWFLPGSLPLASGVVLLIIFMLFMGSADNIIGGTLAFFGPGSILSVLGLGRITQQYHGEPLSDFMTAINAGLKAVLVVSAGLLALMIAVAVICLAGRAVWQLGESISQRARKSPDKS